MRKTTAIEFNSGIFMEDPIKGGGFNRSVRASRDLHATAQP